jgi:hypothetical protein
VSRSRGLVALLLGAVILAACGTPPSRTSSTTGHHSSLEVAAPPKGWVPFAYLDAQVSVPRSWVIELDDCGVADPRQSVIFLSGCSLGQPACLNVPACSFLPDNWLMFSALTAAQAAYDRPPPLVVNGYRVYVVSCSQCAPAYDIPSLGVEIDSSGPMIAKVLSTLSASPRAAVLASGTAPAIPSSWHAVTFAGLEFSVPKSWPLVRKSYYNDCWLYSDLPASPSVALNQGTSGVDEYSTQCPEPQYKFLLSNAPDGVIIDSGGYRREGTTGDCRTMNRLQVCVVTSDPYEELVLSVDVPGRVYPVTVELGLGGNGTVARTILYSMRPS